MITFSPNCENTEKKQKDVKINLSQIIKSSYFGASFIEMTLAKQ